MLTRWLTVTLDVFKFTSLFLVSSFSIWLTVTLDVFKLFG